MQDSPDHRLRRVGIAGGVATVVLLGAGTAAFAASSSTPTPAPTSHSTSSAAPKSAPKSAPKHIPTLDGTVKSADGTSIVITDFDGFSRTIVTSSKTVFKDGLTASPAVGTHLHAEGTVDANKTSLDATVIEKGNTRPRPGGPGGFGGPHGPGHPGGSGTGPGKAGPPPAGRPSKPSTSSSTATS